MGGTNIAFFQKSHQNKAVMLHSFTLSHAQPNLQFGCIMLAMRLPGRIGNSALPNSFSNKFKNNSAYGLFSQIPRLLKTLYSIHCDTTCILFA